MAAHTTLLLAILLFVTLSATLGKPWRAMSFKENRMDSPCEASCTCGMPAKAAAERIIGGEDANTGELPWQVALTTVEDGLLSFYCGGTIVSPRNVLTAATCYNSTLVYRVVAGTVRWNKKNLRHAPVQIARFIVHPFFNSTTLENDLAIITVAQRFVFDEDVMPICLPPTDGDMFKLYDGEDLVTSGWGVINFTSYFEFVDGNVGAHPEGSECQDFVPDVLQKVTLPYIPRCECVRMYDEYFAAQNESGEGFVPYNALCAGVPDGSLSTCFGDGGGPLTVQRDGKTYQVGIVSFGINCGLPDAPAIFADVIRQINWVKRNIYNDCQRH